MLPDIPANAGGVVVSYFEWVQGIASYFWTGDEVNGRLEQIMTKAYHAVSDIARRQKSDMRTASYILGVDRVAEATRVRGIFP